MPAALQTIRWSKVLTTFLLAIMGLLFIMPFLWMISASFKVEADVLKFPIEKGKGCSSGSPTTAKA